MPKRPHGNRSEQFGQPGSGSLSGLDAPMIGAAGAIFSDALTERESGVTPSPPPISVRALVIVFVAMFLVGAVGLAFVMAHDRADAPRPYRFSYAADGTGALSGDFDGADADSFLVSTSSTLLGDGGRSSVEPALTYDASTLFFVNGRTLSVASSDPSTLTINDVNGWPVRVEYVRTGESSRPRATLVEFVVPESQIQDAIDAR